MTKCKICTSESSYVFTAKILDVYDVSYFKCDNCGFIQTEEPYWLDEAYTDVINNSDIGLLNRNLIFSKISKAVLSVFFDSSAKFLDYGGGYGIFVRLMRDLGFDFYWFDKFSDNLFAKGLEANDASVYEAVTAFEVFEHLVDPLTEIEQMMKFSKNILFSTLLIPEDTPLPTEWWYYGLDHGQHISLYSFGSLFIVAEKFHLNLYSNGNNLHLLTEKTISGKMFKLLSHYRIAIIINNFLRRNSLIPDDYFKLTGRKLV